MFCQSCDSLQSNDILSHVESLWRRKYSGINMVWLWNEQALPEPQFINCDIRKFDMSVLGKFGVIMADPPWEIHQDLPYGTMGDDEMRKLNIGCLQVSFTPCIVFQSKFTREHKSSTIKFCNKIHPAVGPSLPIYRFMKISPGCLCTSNRLLISTGYMQAFGDSLALCEAQYEKE